MKKILKQLVNDTKFLKSIVIALIITIDIILLSWITTLFEFMIVLIIISSLVIVKFKIKLT